MSMSSVGRDYFKVVLLGDRSTGKTCMMKRYFNGQFNDAEAATIGGAFESRVFTVEGKEYQMGVWDTSGEERFQSVSSLYYRNSAAAIICYDVTLEKTFHRMKYWINELRDIVPSCRIYISANKLDLLQHFEANPKLSFVRSFAHEMGVKFFLTSNKTGENVDSLFAEILEDYIASTRGVSQSSSTIQLNRKKKKKRKKCCSER